ncbi:PAS domain-containing sensor histidine kinase [Flammeovirga sp. SJP92]|uniref:PAS domain-containing sensor histidine kinase n=1 Tax=Flammeovirga sp. SJP92 TaxID=1775430 RepID=UPI001560B17B|nr:PAS domain S-box protein [Flammeovirga sp. SJP92]
MESLLYFAQEYLESTYSVLCKVGAYGDVYHCVSRYDKGKKVTLPSLEKTITKVLNDKEIVVDQIESHDVICLPIKNFNKNKVLGVLSFVQPRDSEYDYFAMEQVALVGEGLLDALTKRSSTKVEVPVNNSFNLSFKPFFTDSYNLCCITDSDTGNYLFMNQSWERTLGYSIEELKAYNFSNWVHPDDIDETIKVFQDVCDGKVIRSFINRYRTKWGDYKYLEWDATLDEDRRVIYALARDITSQHENHEKLFFQSTILKAVQDSVLVIDLSGKISYINDAVISLTGYPKNYLLGRPLDVILKGVDKSKSISVDVNDFLKDQNNIEFQIERRDGEYIWIEVRTSILEDVYGDPIGFLGIIKDITHRKEYEETLMKRNEELSKANKELDNFVYRVSHDLRAPITSALGLIELSMEATLEEVYEYLKLQQRSLMKLDDFIRDILNYSRNNRMELKPTRVDIQDLIEVTLEQYKFISNYKLVKITKEINVENHLYCDESRLAVILNNLISNAYKFTTLVPNPEIKVEVNVTPNDLILVIEDNGIGIKNDHITKIFDMFYRATDVNNGSGLGLYIVKEAVKRLGGEIAVESILNEGTKFKITIPNLWSIFPKEIREKATN